MTELGIQVRLVNSKSIALDIEFQCDPGEVLAIVGPSGSGKTTVLRAIAGLFNPEQGVIRIQGQTWLDTDRGNDLPAYQRKVGLVFQHYALFPHFTALGNVGAALSGLPDNKRRKRAAELLSRVHLAGLENRYPHELSGGQQQRVAVARALARDPKVILLDEPFSAVDQVTRRRLYRELTELRRSLSTPIILVTHDLQEATLLADRLCILHHGITLQSGSPLDVAGHPASALVAKLMDQQNVFTAQVIKHDKQHRITYLQWRGINLEAKYQPDYPEKAKVCWMIQSANVLLHRRFRPSKGERENPLSGRIIEFMLLGGYANVLIVIDGHQNTTIELSVPVHVARRNQLAIGEQVSVSLLAQHIHLMPFEKLRSSKQGEIHS